MSDLNSETEMNPASGSELHQEEVLLPSPKVPRMLDYIRHKKRRKCSPVTMEASPTEDLKPEAVTSTPQPLTEFQSSLQQLDNSANVTVKSESLSSVRFPIPPPSLHSFVPQVLQPPPRTRPPTASEPPIVSVSSTTTPLTKVAVQSASRFPIPPPSLATLRPVGPTNFPVPGVTRVPAPARMMLTRPATPVPAVTKIPPPAHMMIPRPAATVPVVTRVSVPPAMAVTRYAAPVGQPSPAAVANPSLSSFSLFMEKNPVSAINEYAQRHRLEISYDTGSAGPSHMPEFTAVVKLGSRRFPLARGTTKKDAKSEAASRALQILMQEEFSHRNSVTPKSEVLGVRSGASEYELSVSSVNLGALSPAQLLLHVTQQQFCRALQQLPLTADNMMEARFSGRKVIASIVMRNSRTGQDSVVSLATGNRCITGDCVSMAGDRVIDSHAEVVARRAFLRFLYRQIEICLASGGHNSVVLELSAKDEWRCRVRSHISFHLYISMAPCGDSALFCVKDGNGTAPTWVPPEEHAPLFESPAHGILRTKIENGEGTIPVEKDAAQLTFDGLIRGDRLRTMACSDKVLRWNVVGLQGCLLSHFLEPVYLSSVVVGTLYEPQHLARAVCCRAERLLQLREEREKLISLGFSIHHPQLGSVGEDVTATGTQRNTTKTNELSLNWYFDPAQTQPVEVTDGTTGMCVTKSGEKPTPSRLCKLQMLQCFHTLIRYSQRTDLDPQQTYAALKAQAVPYRQALALLRKSFIREHLGKWLSKPIELQQFKVK